MFAGHSIGNNGGHIGVHTVKSWEKEMIGPKTYYAKTRITLVVIQILQHI